MKFESHGRKYEVDKFGVIVQTDHRPFTYDAEYSAIYDNPEYTRQSELLQAMRYGFICAAHGKLINSLLDVGYGNGAFINFAKQHVPYVYGHDVTGVPLDGAYQMPEIVKADVITMWDVLEHFPSVEFVRELPSETLVVSLPYCHFLTEGKEWFEIQYKHRKPDEHIRHFNQFSLSAMMDSLGWKEMANSRHEDIVRKSAHGLPNILSMAFKRK
jgi:hypothetical protein